MAILFAGRVAEAVVFGVISTGARDDLEMATDLARSMFEKFGMSDQLGTVAFARSQRSRS